KDICGGQRLRGISESSKRTVQTRRPTLRASGFPLPGRSLSCLSPPDHQLGDRHDFLFPLRPRVAKIERKEEIVEDFAIDLEVVPISHVQNRLVPPNRIKAHINEVHLLHDRFRYATEVDGRGAFDQAVMETFLRLLSDRSGSQPEWWNPVQVFL